MKSLRCVCGRVLTAENGEALLAEVERHLHEVLAHAELIRHGTDLERTPLPGRDATDMQAIAAEAKEEK